MKNDPGVSAPTEGLPEGLLSPGQVLGERYQIRSQLGRGGMGEVWRAFDLKLRVEVALKAMREDLFKDARRRDLLRREVRAAREVVSPNVCRIFDLVEVDGHELVSMEYVDGGTLLEVLRERGPLELKEAQDIASQFLAGLEAIHRAGLVHRDVKPENIMLTRAGRVVVMDFGLARQEDSGAGTVSGTPAYMAPEQAAGLPVDPRADVYAAGVIIAEMVAPEGIKSLESRQSVWEGVRQEPARVPDTPWAPVLRKAVAKNRDDRYNSAHTLTRALEDVTLRVEGAEDLMPYPGLASFTEADAEFFFGREAEVEQIWRKLDRPHLLAVVGPSGAGKTSFLRAGLTPSAGPEWGILRCTPGSAPFTALGQALAREMVGDVEAMELLARGHDPDALVGVVARWRQSHDNILFIIDQFEELFTHSSVDEQQRFSDLIGRMPLEADVFVLLSMRDDFLIRCREQGALAPVFTDLTALLAPSGGSLRRAVVQPATTCGYRFEDDALVEEMLAEVEGERGALPLLAFSLARLWEKRDREGGVLTRQAFQDIGGVAGALARHAETTIERIGSERIGCVRELFRNLVTAEGTRAVGEWDELLSIFGKAERRSAEEVLRALIDARLLTSYEVRGEDERPARRVEIIHESLLANWPRLVRWRTQDQEGAQIRDELRQAARSWDEHGQHDDRLWTGTAYREFRLWREHYPGGLSEIEEAFATAMISLATSRRRRRRIAVAAVIAILAAGLAVVGSFWRQSERQTRIAEAQRLLTLGQLDLERYPTAALAWARTSLGVADTAEGRLFALKALANGPIGRVLEFDQTTEGIVQAAFFSPNGEWVSFMSFEKLKVRHRSRGPTMVVDTFPTSGFSTFTPFFDASSTRLGVWKFHSDRRTGEIRTYEVPGFAEIGRINKQFNERFDLRLTHRGAFSHFFPVDGMTEIWHWPFGGEWTRFDRVAEFGACDFDSQGTWMACQRDTNIYLHSLVEAGTPPRKIGHLNVQARRFRVDPDFQWIAASESGSAALTVWPLDSEPRDPLRNLDTRGLGSGRIVVDRQGRRIGVNGTIDGEPTALVWHVESPVGAMPLVLRTPDSEYTNGLSFDPDGRWAVTGNINHANFWPMPETPTVILPGNRGTIYSLAFTPDASALVVPAMGGGVRYIPLSGDAAESLLQDGGSVMLAMDPEGRFVTVNGTQASVAILPLDGSEPRQLAGFERSAFVAAVAYDPERELIAAAAYRGPREQKVIRVWKLEDESVRVLGPNEDAGDGFDGGYRGLEFLPDGRLLSAGKAGVRRWSLDSGTSELLFPEDCLSLDLSPDGDTAAVAILADPTYTGPVAVIDLASGKVRRLEAFGTSNTNAVFGPRSDYFATASGDGAIRVGRLSGGEPHILFGHTTMVNALAFSPDGRWLASGDDSGTVRVWPAPDISQPAPHTMPYNELLAKLDTFTNLRVVRDEESSTGWKLEAGPFPGWENLPSW